VLNGFSLRTLSIYGQLWNKITFYPVIEGAYVSTKNWYREETDLWAEFGRRAPFSRRFSSKYSVEASAVWSTSSFGRRAVPRLKEKSIQERVMTWIEYKEGGQIDDGCETDIGPVVLILGNKCCNRGKLGVVLERGYKYEPLVFLIGIEQFHNEPAPCQLSSPSSRVVEFFVRSHQYSTSVSTGNLVSCLVSCGGFRP
jgi:hypothetical protein